MLNACKCYHNQNVFSKYINKETAFHELKKTYIKIISYNCRNIISNTISLYEFFTCILVQIIWTVFVSPQIIKLIEQRETILIVIIIWLLLSPCSERKRIVAISPLPSLFQAGVCCAYPGCLWNSQKEGHTWCYEHC